jgi:hypothetical protein
VKEPEAQVPGAGCPVPHSQSMAIQSLVSVILLTLEGVQY